MLSVIFEEISKIGSANVKKVRQFSWLLSAVFLGLALWNYREKSALYLLSISVLFFIISALRPLWLKALYKLWMALAILLGAVVSGVILTLFFYLVITPLGLSLRLFRKDLLDEKFGRAGISYWKKHIDAADKNQYHKMF